MGMSSSTYLIPEAINFPVVVAPSFEVFVLVWKSTVFGEYPFLGLSLNHRDWNIRLVVKNVIRTLANATHGHINFHIDAAIGESDFFAHLLLQVPTSQHQCRGDEFGTDIAF